MTCIQRKALPVSRRVLGIATFLRLFCEFCEKNAIWRFTTQKKNPLADELQQGAEQQQGDQAGVGLDPGSGRAGGQARRGEEDGGRAAAAATAAAAAAAAAARKTKIPEEAEEAKVPALLLSEGDQHLVL